MKAYVSRCAGDKRKAGISLVYRRGDWLYLDIDLWFISVMVNLFRV